MKMWMVNIFLLEGLVFLGAIVLLIVLINKRIKDKKNETFEKRDN
jgi:hypothetical protein